MARQLDFAGSWPVDLDSGFWGVCKMGGEVDNQVVRVQVAKGMRDEQTSNTWTFKLTHETLDGKIFLSISPIQARSPKLLMKFYATALNVVYWILIIWQFINYFSKWQIINICSISICWEVDVEDWHVVCEAWMDWQSYDASTYGLSQNFKIWIAPLTHSAENWPIKGLASIFSQPTWKFSSADERQYWFITFSDHFLCSLEMEQMILEKFEIFPDDRLDIRKHADKSMRNIEPKVLRFNRHFCPDSIVYNCSATTQSGRSMYSYHWFSFGTCEISHPKHSQSLLRWKFANHFTQSMGMDTCNVPVHLGIKPCRKTKLPDWETGSKTRDPAKGGQQGKTRREAK